MGFWWNTFDDTWRLHDLYHTIIAEYSCSPCVGTITKQPENTKLIFQVQCAMLVVLPACWWCLYIMLFQLAISPCYQSTWWILGGLLHSFSKLKSPKQAHIQQMLPEIPSCQPWDSKVIFGNVCKCPSLMQFVWDNCFPMLAVVQEASKHKTTKAVVARSHDDCEGRRSLLLVCLVAWNQSLFLGGLADVRSSFSETL